jgi:hypothetical protein
LVVVLSECTSNDSNPPSPPVRRRIVSPSPVSVKKGERSYRSSFPPKPSRPNDALQLDRVVAVEVGGGRKKSDDDATTITLPPVFNGRA